MTDAPVKPSRNGDAPRDEDQRVTVRRSDHTVTIALIAAFAAIAVPFLTSTLGFLNANHQAALLAQQQAALLLKTDAIAVKVVEVGHTTDSTLVRVDGRLTQALEMFADLSATYASEHPGDAKAQQRAKDARSAARTPPDRSTAQEAKASDAVPLEGRVMPIEHPQPQEPPK